MKICPVCAGPIERGGRRGGPLPTYCTPRCKQRARSEREERDGRAEGRRQRKLEAAECERAQRTPRPCPHCGDPMSNLRRTQCGKLDCVKQAKAKRMRDYMKTLRNADGEVGDRYQQYQREGNKRRRETLGHWRQLYPESAARIDALRRMRIQAATVESFAPREVYERDGWVCQLCRLPIDPCIAWPGSMSPSVDHVVPLAKGGQHSMANAQAAHLGCNSRKRDRLEAPAARAVIQRAA